MRYRRYGAFAIGPLLGSLRLVPTLTKEQRDRLPLILETIGPSIIPALVRELQRPARARPCNRRGCAWPAPCLETVPLLAALVGDPSEMVRQSVVEALGILGSLRAGSAQSTARPWSGPRREGRKELALLRRNGSNSRSHQSTTRSSSPWRRFSRPWPTTRRRCGSRLSWRWAGSGRPRRRRPRD